MCGICGFIDSRFERRPDETILRSMMEPLRPRGPDDEGMHMDAGVALGHRRLSIIDIESGRQPIGNEDESLWLVFNGEIYNFPEIRDRLLARGHVFKSRSDTEVIVHLYEEEGIDCLKTLNGMFALALWDAKQRTLFLARDRIGQKPLYYAERNGSLFFSSELKSLLRHPALDPSIERASLAKYLLFEYVPGPHTIYAGIHKLPAASYLVFREGQTTIRSYWDLRAAVEAKPLLDEEALKECITEKLKASIKRRLISDVPLGVFVSGGIDSSSILTLISELMPRKEIGAFCIGFEDKSFDESTYARKISEINGVDYRERFFVEGEMLKVLPEVASYLDEPFADASVLPTYLLARFAREKITVALGGDGGDELFAGYPTFQAEKIAGYYRRLVPPWVHRNVFQRLGNALPVSFDNISFDFRVKTFLGAVLEPEEHRHFLWLGSFSPKAQSRLLAPGFIEGGEEALFSDVKDHLAAADCPPDPLNRLLYLYLKTYLQDDLLVKTDRACMANSLELRSPFLDHELVELAFSIPSRLKLKGLKTKYILRQTMANRLPRNLLQRPKKGFGIPAAKWIRGELKDLIGDVLAEDKVRREGFFEPKEVRRLIREHQEGRKDNRKKIWTLLMFELWLKNHFEAASR